MADRGSEEWRQHISLARRGHKISDEHKKQISVALKGRKFTETHRAAISKGQMGNLNALGYRHTDDSKQKISDMLRGRKFTDERKDRLRIAQKGAYHPPFTEDHRRNMGKASKASWDKLSSEERGTRVAKSLRAITKPSSLERLVCQVLDAVGIQYESQVPVGRYVVDILLADRNLIIECDGDYWHSLPGRAERDRQRDAYLSEVGYKVIHLTENEIHQDSEQALLGHMELAQAVRAYNQKLRAGEG